MPARHPSGLQVDPVNDLRLFPCGGKFIDTTVQTLVLLAFNDRRLVRGIDKDVAGKQAINRTVLF